MPYCPKCKYEYEYGVGMCPDCDERLVDSLPEENDSDDVAGQMAKKYDDWVLLANLTSQYFASMCHEGLTAKNIPAVILSGTGHFGMTGQMGITNYRPIDGNYKLYVPKEFSEDAAHEASVILGDDWDVSRAIE